MPLTMTVSDVIPLSERVWSLKMAPYEIRYFGESHHAIGKQSVLLLRSCEFDPAARRLSFPLGSAVPLNVGTTESVLVLLAEDPPAADKIHSPGFDFLARGDRAFLEMAKAELTREMASAAEKLLRGVRERSPGELKRGKARNFSDTPDNFWYVIVQPRIGELSITVRGSISHFEGVSRLGIKDDRGNTRFKVRSERDVADALKLIFHALRKA